MLSYSDFFLLRAGFSPSFAEAFAAFGVFFAGRAGFSAAVSTAFSSVTAFQRRGFFLRQRR